jgi:hypothetical protein
MKKTLYCKTCAITFASHDIARHKHCSKIDCAFCREYPVPPSQIKTLIDLHQNKMGYPMCCGLFPPLFKLQRNEKKTVEFSSVCHSPYCGLNLKCYLLYGEVAKCVKCFQLIPKDEINTHQNDSTVFESVDFHLSQLNLTVLEVHFPKELRNIIAEYCVFSLSCDSFSVCIGCLQQRSKLDMINHYALCPQVIQCKCCNEICHKAVFESHLLFSTKKCRQFVSYASCPYCGDKVWNEDFALHKLRCPCAPTQCSHCRKKMKLKEIEDHLLLSCPSKRKGHHK